MTRTALVVGTLHTGALAWVVACVVGCSDPEPPPAAPTPVPVETAPEPEPEPKPTPEQEKALKNPLHIAHMEYEPEPDEDEIKCRACHSVEGRERPPMEPRCLGCHEDNESAVHAQISNEDAKRCLTCHDFESETTDAWACAACHTRAGAPNRPPGNFGRAPRVSVHASEECQSCHVPHGDEGPLSPGPCIECHEDSRSRHHAELADPERCLECHGGHEKASVAATECASCHREVPASAAFRGHECTSCHEPHQRPPVRACEGCHADAVAHLDPSATEHQECASCHEPHTVTAGHDACTTCHDVDSFAEPDSTHPAPIEGHDTCVDCHTVAAHVPNRPPTPCGSCHRPVARTLTRGHEDCASCHEPHSGVSDQACLDCHEAQHGAGPHATASGECAQCHRPHGPSGVAEPLACVECHDERLPALHAIAEHQACGDCHEFHAERERHDRAGCVEPCHSDLSNHQADAKSCTGCHVFGGTR